MRIRAPGLFSTRSEMIWIICLPTQIRRPVLLGSDGLGRAEDHFADGGARRDHGVRVFEWRQAHIQQVWPRLLHSRFQRRAQFVRMIDGTTFKSVSAGKLLGIGEGIELDR